MVQAGPYGVHPRTMPVDLAKVHSPIPMLAADREDAMVVVVTKSGDIFFKSDKTTSDQLPWKIREDLSYGAEKKVYIKADA